ncbi:hypothetical protein I203_104229 [Kwoniella mangroviensis CBS 8507]|uniref:uncharacterized protein n=1 Tax=Kwoniella mangroviensis CBS 8507 TaxID=1296122 RepID=UPI00080D3777|nr:uncharacterized protein I203_00825 [Kwoniella mangroviensis CBS 8507]OCF70690.1 hypothetical protein I203_00825 [Kwoniella mangroviensis CBS 8507]
MFPLISTHPSTQRRYERFFCYMILGILIIIIESHFDLDPKIERLLQQVWRVLMSAASLENLLIILSDESSTKSYTASPDRFTLPNDVLRHIAAVSDRATLGKLMQVFWGCHDIVGPILYSKVQISRENARKVFMGLATTPYDSRIVRTKPRKKANAIENIRKSWWGSDYRKRFILGYPYTPYKEEDEEDFEPPHQVHDYPTVKSHNRKLQLLTNVKHLTIASLPSRIVSEDFAACVRHNFHNHGEDKPFSNVGTLVVKGQAVYDMALWIDDPLSRTTNTGHNHPFIYHLLNSMRPKAVCVSYPQLTTEHVERSLDKRLSPISPYLPEDQQTAIREQASNTYRNYVHRLYRTVNYFTEIPKWTLDSFTIHQHKIGCLPYLSKCVKVFFESCHCDDSPDIHCLQHTADNKRRTMLNSLANRLKSLSLPRNKKKDCYSNLLEHCVLVMPKPRSKPEGDGAKEQWSEWKESIGQSHPSLLWQKDTIIMGWDEADPCSCCGLK